MSGFIDPEAHLRDRIGRLEILVAALLRGGDLSSMEAMIVVGLNVDASEALHLREHRLLKSLGYDETTVIASAEDVS